jgi:tRNA(Ile)-lysidine synthase
MAKQRRETRQTQGNGSDGQPTEQDVFQFQCGHRDSEEQVTNSLDKIVANHPLTAAVRRALPRLLPAGGGIVVAVSGGPDSVALLTVLHALDVNPLVVAHINHHLRGPESDADAAFVENLATRFCLPFRLDHAPIPEHASIEATARQLRYEKLRGIAQSLNISNIATAHTLDDQAETIVMRLLRGTGLTGLGGIPPIRRWRGIRIIRPLLHVRRECVVDLLSAAGVGFRTDSSNTDPRFTRNRIRHELLPVMTQNAPPNLVERLGRLSREARRLNRAIIRQAREDIHDCELAKAGFWTILDAAKLAALSSDRTRELWRVVWQREGWPPGEMTRQHWQRLAEVAHGQAIAVDCPGGIRVRRLDRIVRAGPGA